MENKYVVAGGNRPLFLDLSVAISYEVALQVCQQVLRSFAHGGIKAWARDQQPPINYTMLVNLKNGNLPRPFPQLVQRILLGLGLPTQVFREAAGTYFMFEQREHFTQVQQHLAQAATRQRPSNK